jgi:hypothetical protein
MSNSYTRSTKSISYEYWNGNFFESCTLQELGLVVHLGHNGWSCPQSFSTMKNFVVIDLSGVHKITVSFCGCVSAETKENIPHRTQLLRHTWFPATTLDPHTAFTFDLLNTFQLLNLQSKISAHDFWNTIANKTSTTNAVPVSFSL